MDTDPNILLPTCPTFYEKNYYFYFALPSNCKSMTYYSLAAKSCINVLPSVKAQPNFCLINARGALHSLAQRETKNYVQILYSTNESRSTNYRLVKS